MNIQFCFPTFYQQVGLHQTKKLLQNKGNEQKNEKQLTEWETIFTNHIYYKRLISTIYKDHIQFNGNKTQQLKMGRGSEETFFQRHTDGQQVHENMPNITNHWGNANQNHNMIRPHTC